MIFFPIAKQPSKQNRRVPLN